MAEEQQALEKRFREALDESPFMMLGLKGSGFTRPMTAQIDKHRKIYFFASRDEELVRNLSGTSEAIATYSSKGHDFFASVGGRLVIDNDRQKIDELWSPLVEQWYDEGKQDPRLVLLRFDADRADVWNAGTQPLLKAAWVKLTGGDPGAELENENRAEFAV